MGQFWDDEMKAVMERACAQRDAAVARAEKVEAERDKAWADMDRLRVGADAEITKLEGQRDRAHTLLMEAAEALLIADDHGLPEFQRGNGDWVRTMNLYERIRAALADEPPATALIERICDEYDGAFRALADEPPPETRRAKALQKLAALPSFDATVLMVPLDDEPPKEKP